MGFLDWLGISARDAPPVTDSVRDSGQTFVFGKADSGEKVDEKSAMQIATVYACVRLLAETVAGLPLHLYRFSDEAEKDKERAKDHPLYTASPMKRKRIKSGPRTILCTNFSTGSRIRR